MLPNLFPTIRDSPAVTAIIGSNPVRFYPHGQATQTTVAPYITWRPISIVPQNNISTSACVDDSRCQLSCWSDNTGTGIDDVETLYAALRAAVEPYFMVLDVRVGGRDTETQRYRIDVDVQVWVDPAPSSS